MPRRYRRRKFAGFNPKTLVTLIDATPKLHIRTKRLSLAEAKLFHAHLGQLIAEIEGGGGVQRTHHGKRK